VAGGVILFLIIGQLPLILLVALLVLCYLTAIDLRPEDDLPFLIKAWWVLLVFLTNVVGYLAFRIWLATRRRRRSA
jgi:hypothetical protein